MHLSIRSKLFVSIVVPLLGISAVVMYITLSRLHTISREKYQNDATELAQHYAAKLDAQFQAVAQVARSTAAFLTAVPGVSESQLYEVLRNSVAQNSLIYGAGIAFAPHALEAERRLIAPYVYRGASGLEDIDIGTAAYDYTDARWSWFAEPESLGEPIWTEPFYDESTDDTLMVIYSAPFFQDGFFRGVATVSVSLLELQCQAGIAGLRDNPVIIVGRNGMFISHPDSELVMRETITGLAQKRGRPDLVALGKFIARGEPGLRRVQGLTGTGQDWVFFAPIESTGWTFATSVPEATMMAFTNAQFARALIGLGILITLLILSVFLVGNHLTRPIERLAMAVRRLGSGDFSAQAMGVRSRDEIGELAGAFNAMVGELKRRVDAETRERLAREAVESELRVARTIQANLLPRNLLAGPKHPEFDLCAVNAPARHVAGDFYDFFCPSADTLLLVIADVSGKGVPAAMLMAVTRTLVRNLGMSGMSSSAILNEANRLLFEDSTSSMFVTLFVAQYFFRTGQLIYANGGHPPPLRMSANGQILALDDSSGTLVGAFEESTYEQHESRLTVGDTLVLFTDGISEARSTAGDAYQLDRLKAVLSAHSNASIEALCKQVIDEVDHFQGKERSDDQTMLILRRNG